MLLRFGLIKNKWGLTIHWINDPLRIQIIQEIYKVNPTVADLLQKSGIRSPQIELSIKLSSAKSLKILTAEPKNYEPQNIEVKKIVSFLSKTSAVRHSLFDIRYSKYNIGTL